MITGLELTLAIIPLVISATEHHGKIIRRSKGLLFQKNKDEQMLDFLLALHCEIALLRHILRQVVNESSSVTLEQKRRLLEANLGQWDEVEISLILEDRVSGSEDAFRQLLQQWLRSLEIVVSDRSLGLARPDVQDSSSICRKLEAFQAAMRNGNSAHDLRDRVRFTRHEKARTIGLKKLREHNEGLQRFLQGPRQPPEFSRQDGGTRKRRLPLLLLKSRRLSIDLYEILGQKLSVPCSCPIPHEARLCLSNPSVDLTKMEAGLNMEMLISIYTNPADLNWQESMIQVPHEDETITHTQSSNPRVRFVMSNHDSPSTLPDVRVAPYRDIDSEPLCSLLSQAHSNQACLQIIFERGKLWQAQSRRNSIPIAGPSIVALTDLLRQPDRVLKMRDQRLLAVTLAHAVLTYCESPWLKEGWAKDHITFLSRETSGPELHRPFLLTTFHSPGVTELDTGLKLLKVFHPSPTLLSLGIMLLEIHLNAPIEERWSADDLTDGVQNANTNFTTALRLLHDLEGDIYDGYRTAIEACLKFKQEDLSKERLQQEIYDRIVAPLEQELLHGFGVKMGPLG